MLSHCGLNNPVKAQEYFEHKLAFTVSPTLLMQMLEEGRELCIIDVRDPDEYVDSHIPHAINLPRQRWRTMQGLNHDCVNIIYSDSGCCHLADEACAYFARMGYSVKELDGGLRGWRDAQLPLTEAGGHPNQETARGREPLRESQSVAFVR
jgi:rhodanese-related sulfurtransferase